jgi:hypothetical protein
MLYPTRLSLSTSGATPQAAQLTGKGKNGLGGWNVVHLAGVCMRAEPGAPACGGAEGMSWLRSPSYTCSPVMRCIEFVPAGLPL